MGVDSNLPEMSRMDAEIGECIELFRKFKNKSEPDVEEFLIRCGNVRLLITGLRLMPPRCFPALRNLSSKQPSESLRLKHM
jgi:hypothetical protein